MKIIKYKLFASSEDFEKWQLEKNISSILQISPIMNECIPVDSTDNVSFGTRWGIFVTYFEIH